MARWDYHVKVKHLLTDDEDLEGVQVAMNAVADVLEKKACFREFYDLISFRQIPKGDDFFGPADYANRMLDMMYNYADEHRIWVG